MTLTLHGIKNCDTMKKAFTWLEKRKLAYVFRDYKKDGIDEDTITRAITQYGWENVLNRKGTTWRALPDAVKDGMTAKTALKIARENPSLLRRPILTRGKEIHIGFDEEVYGKLFHHNH